MYMSVQSQLQVLHPIQVNQILRHNTNAGNTVRLLAEHIIIIILTMTGMIVQLHTAVVCTR